MIIILRVNMNKHMLLKFVMGELIVTLDSPIVVVVMNIQMELEND